MTQENRELLLKEVYARLRYGVKILHKGWNYEWDQELSTVERVTGIDNSFIYTKVIDTHTGEEYREDKHSISLFDDKLFLRPMSSMTEKELSDLWVALDKDMDMIMNNLDAKIISIYKGRVYRGNPIHHELDFLNAHHFDYQGLIEKGLALEASEGMYK